MRKFVSPFTALDFFGSSLNPLGFNGAPYDELTGNELVKYAIQFRGNPFVLDMADMPQSPHHPNHEVVVSSLRLTAGDMAGSPRPVTFSLNHTWRNPEGATVFAIGGSVTIKVGDLIPTDFALYSFIGWVNGEIDHDGTYHCDQLATSTVEPDVGSVRPFTIQNSLMSNYEKGAGSEGYLWLGNDSKIHYIDGEQFEHAVPEERSARTQPGHTGKGQIYVDTKDGISN